MAAPKKVSNFQVIASAQIGERIPRVPSAYHFALPYPGDEAIDWSLYFAGIKPRAFLVSKYPAGHAKAGQIYPLSLAAANASLATDKENFLGVVIDGHNYDQDLNITVTLAAGIPLMYLQGDVASAAETVDPLVEAFADQLGLRIYSKNVFWSLVDAPARPEVHQTVIAGGVAGNHTVTGIGLYDQLVSVVRYATGVPSDITAEFDITADNTINNTGGTDTTGNQLVVTWSSLR